MKKVLAFVLVLILVAISLATLLVAFNQGGLLQARSFSKSQTQTNDNTKPTPTLEGSSQQANSCEQAKQVHIADCGEGLPENYDACSTQEANEVFSNCMNFGL